MFHSLCIFVCIQSGYRSCVFVRSDEKGIRYQSGTVPAAVDPLKAPKIVPLGNREGLRRWDESEYLPDWM